ncbi:hypothetical protein F5Y04DRAFT_292233 [Hypomontagnella monticulosa]|nr:hypothetical protein F5Y04DRAFT_292233 [Hypomontagnella monticulosa]
MPKLSIGYFPSKCHMDPVSIIQIVGVVVSLGDVVVRCIAGLSSLRAKYHDAPVHITTMIGNLSIVRTAMDQLSVFRSPELSRIPRYRELASQMGNALDSFGPLMEKLDRELSRLNKNDHSGRARNRLAFIWSERAMFRFSEDLGRQVNALSLLLQAIQCRTQIEQNELIGREGSQSILELARHNSSSKAASDDKRSSISETTTAISTEFEFDKIILSSRPYQEAQRSYLRQVIRAGVPPGARLSVRSKPQAPSPWRGGLGYLRRSWIIQLSSWWKTFQRGEFGIGAWHQGYDDMRDYVSDDILDYMSFESGLRMTP